MADVVVGDAVGMDGFGLEFFEVGGEEGEGGEFDGVDDVFEGFTHVGFARSLFAVDGIVEVGWAAAHGCEDVADGEHEVVMVESEERFDVGDCAG